MAEEALASFMAVTGADEARSRFYLELSGGDLQMALASFYEEADEGEVVAPPAPPAGGGSSSSSGGGGGGAPQPAPVVTGGGRGSRIAGLRDLQQQQDDDSDEEEGQRFYAGGSEHSGQQIVGPPRKRNPNEIVENLFKEAKEHGAVPVDSAARGGEPSGSRAFSGGGYRLGASGSEESAYVAGQNRAEAAQDVNVVLKLWKNGFSIDNGDLRDYGDPASAQFLSAIKRGEIPLELRRMARGGQVNLDMEDHRDLDYVKPKSKFKAFGGEGQKLGSPTPHVVNAPTGAQPVAATAAAAADTESDAPLVQVDETAPTTSLQIRLADGGRLLQKFNHTHRLRDVRQLIVQSRPAMAASPFVLMTTFPSRELTDEEQTLGEANLLNAVIVQRIK
ncbi:NSFL1 cofactor p47-like [Petromyzon marinus]|uniref:NSFL1 cofactor p47-like n=1 Tax=Petromyzon marinus TaxID=7757 RepID=UPI003F72521B